MDKSNKPPLGLRPKHIAYIDRAVEIIEAMKRYSQEAKRIPIDWITELEEINKSFSE